MKILNYRYLNELDFCKFVELNSIQNENNVLIQLFYSGLESDYIKTVRTQIISLLPKAALIGTSTAGIINDKTINDNSLLISFSIFEKSSAKSVSYCHKDKDFILNDLLNFITDKTKLIIAFANIMRIDATHILHSLSLHHSNIVVTGGNAGDDFKFSSCYTFSRCCQDCDIAFAIIDSDFLKVRSNYFLNWQTIGQEMMITKSNGATVYEIDNKKALDVFKHYLGDEVVQNMFTHGVEFPLIYQENQTNIARAAVGVDETIGSITFAGMIKEGTKVRFGYADIEYIENQNKKQIQETYINKNEATFIYSCAARRQMLGTYLFDEISMLGDLGEHIGFITYGEFFHNGISCQNDLLNITTTFVTLNENELTEKISFTEQTILKDKKDIALKAMTKLISETSAELEEYKTSLKYELDMTSRNFEEASHYSHQYEYAINKMSAVIKTNLNHTIISANEKLCEIIGYNKNKIIGSKIDNFFHMDNSRYDALQQGVSYSTILTSITKQNKNCTVATFCYPITNLNGNIIEYIYIMHDITEIFTMKENIENERNILKVIFENIPDLLWIKDTNGVYIACNKRFESFYGADKQDIIGKTDYDFVDKDLADFFRQHDKKAESSPVPMSNFEEVSFASDGHKEYLHTTKSKILKTNGEILGVVGVARDITSIKNNEDKLKEQQNELQTIFDTTKDGLAVMDLQTNFLKVNKAYCEITGLSEEELLQTSCFALSAPEDEEKAHLILNEFVKKGIVENFEKTCLVKGRRITVILSASWMPDKQHILLGMKDITKNKLFEEQSKLAAMGEMIGNIAHQWRQPLSVITTISSGIKLRSDYGQLEDYDVVPDMDVIVKQAQYLSKTIDDFRNFIKNSNDIQRISIKETIEKTLSILHSAMANHHITIIKDLKDDLMIDGYQNELMQSFINIINNARDAIDDNIEDDDDKLIFVSISKTDDILTVSIKDSGGGIPEHAMHRIFEPYFTTKHQSIGTGIGLSMTYKMITQRHNASIDVNNEEYSYNGKEYKGACFKIIFNKD